MTVIGSLQVQQTKYNIAQINPTSDTTWSSIATTTTTSSSSSSSVTDLQQLNITAINVAPSGSLIFTGQTSEQPSNVIIGQLDSNQQYSEIASSLQQKQQGDNNNELSSSLLPGSVINQVLLVPVTEASANQPRYPSNTNTVLMVVGNIQLSKGGNASIAIYDSAGWSPYILSSQFNGDPGLASLFFYSKDTWDGSQTKSIFIHLKKNRFVYI